MKLENLLKDVPPEHHGSFITFLETGEASPNFLELIDKSPECQRVVDAALTQQASALRGFVQALAHAPREAVTEKRPPAEAAIIGGMVATALGEVLHLPPEQRSEVVHSAVVQLGKTGTAGERKEAKQLILDLGRSAQLEM